MKKRNRVAEKYLHAVSDEDYATRLLLTVGDQEHAARLLCFDPMTGDYTWTTAAEWIENQHLAWNGIVTGNLQNILIMADAFDLITHKKRRKKH